MRFLHSGRIVLEAGAEPVQFQTGEMETGLIALRGSATVRADGQDYTLGRYDALYVSRDCAVRVTPSAEGCDLAEIAAPVAPGIGVARRFRRGPEGSGSAHDAGGPAAKRDLTVLIGRTSKPDDHGRRHLQRAGQLDVVAAAEHAAMLEETYLCIECRRPSSACSCSTPMRASPRWPPSCATATSC
jgi:hypothetical protein